MPTFATSPPRMTLGFQRGLDRVLGVPLCALLSLLERVRPRRVPEGPPRKILVILLSEMGSLVLAHPLFARLKEEHGGAGIYALLLARNREVLDLLCVVPEDNVLTLDDRSLLTFARDVVSAVRKLRSTGIDAVIDCELFARISSILSYLTGAPLRVGFLSYTQKGLYRGSYINRGVLYNPYRHFSRQLLTMAAALKSDTLPPGKDELVTQELKLPPASLSREEVRGLSMRIDRDFPQTAGRSLVLVHPSGGVLPIRAWPLESFEALAKSLVDEGHAVGVIGLGEDRDLGEAIVSKVKSPLCLNLAGFTRSVRELLALFHRASLLVLNDSGPGQFAALTGVPAIVLFGPETPSLYGPLGQNVTSLHLSLPCSPCLTAFNHRVSPCDGDNQCLKRITPELVLQKARELLARPGTQGGAPPLSAGSP